ncbi:MAG: selenocysteine-specific translation elongation factor [Candidatus Longimicrobiales bacterium M2_2A_002]
MTDGGAVRGIVGTAGHIDHGKTALIGALTGEHTDRLPEEQERGISIDLGFSHLDTDRGTIGVIDVPGHEDFIRNMLAGATGIDVLLLVVAADEGVMPQTREHTAIADLLGVHRAVVALTKTDLVDDEWLGLVHDDIADFLADSPFAGAPVIPTSTADGTGIEAVRGALEEVFDSRRGRPDDLFRMPVDRTFTVRGTGTVVTGTVWSGRLARDSTVRILPGGLDVRVRGLQVHGGSVDAVEAGQRAAIALAGVDRDAVPRGSTVVTHPGWDETTRLTTSLRVLPGVRWSIEPWQRLRVHLATAEVMARAVLLDADRLDPGRQGLIQLRLETPLVARAGDRFVVRSYSPVTTIGGGVVLEPIPPKRTAVGADDLERLAALPGDDATAAVEAVLAEAGGAGIRRDRLPVDTGAAPPEVDRALAGPGAVEVGDRAFAARAVTDARERLLAAVDRYHQSTPTRPGIDPAALRQAAAADAADELVEHALDALLEDAELVTRRGRVARADFHVTLTPEQRALRDRLLEAVRAGGVAPPRLDELVGELDASPSLLEDLVELLEAEGTLVRIEHDLHIHADPLAGAVRRVRERLGGRTGLSPGEFRDVLEVSRRHLIPLLEYFDRTGVTAREADGRAVIARGASSRS